jgi:DNA replication protein DnaC
MTHLDTAADHLSAAAAAVFGVRYATVSGLARAVRSSYSKLATKTEEDILDDHVSPSLLVLDEVGVGLGTDHERAMMHDVLACRYDRKKPTILVSNLSLEEVKEALGDRIVDRIREDKGTVLECSWQSWRGRP